MKTASSLINTPEQRFQRNIKSSQHFRKMNIDDFMLTCPSKRFLGVECPGCGAQRAVVLVFEGKFSEAFQMYPAVYTILLFLFILGISFIDRKRKYGPVLMALLIINLTIIIGSYVYKHVFLQT